MPTTQTNRAATARRTTAGTARAAATVRRNGAGSSRTAAPARKRGGTSGTGRSASPSSRSRSSTQTRTRKAAKAAPAARPVRREIGALVCFLLGIFATFGYFNIRALFITFYVGTLKGLLGYGFWLVPPALFMAAWILAFHRGNPVRLRVTCALLIPCSMSCLLHGLLARVLPWNGGLIGTLWAGGQSMHSGGVLGGILAQMVVTLVSGLGCTIVFGLATVFLTLTACDRTLADVADWLFNRDYPEYEVKPRRERVRRVPVAQEARPSRLQQPARAPARPAPRQPVRVPARAPVGVTPMRRRTIYNIPIDEGPLPEDVFADGERTADPAGEDLSRGEARPGTGFPESTAEGFRDGNPEEEQAAGEYGSLQSPSDRFPSGAQAGNTRRDTFWEDDLGMAGGPAAQERANPDQPLFPSEESFSPPAPASSGVTRTGTGEGAVPALEKVTHQEASQAAAEVTEHIAQSLEARTPPYQFPPISLLQEGEGEAGGAAMAELNGNRQRLSDTIHSFGIEAKIVNVTRGPSVTRYELELDQGVRLNKLTNLADDIALSLGASGVRIAPIPDQISLVGIEVPNKTVSPVSIRSVLSSRAFTRSTSKVSFAVGKDIGGECIVGNIAKMPHMLIAGTTGSGKSVCTNSLIVSLLYKAKPDEVRLIMVDPKMVELGIYNGIPHLLIPVVTDARKAAGALQWAVNEMMRRYSKFAEQGVRDLESYNRVAARIENLEVMPQVVVIIDELADLMLVAAKEVEESICRVAQMGRASGMHLVIATQRPSSDVITGLMKANIPSRIAFAVASSLESRIILDQAGAEKLVGRGDMLYFPLGSGKPMRIQGCLITDQEVADVVGFVKQNNTAQYDEQVMHDITEAAPKDSSRPREDSEGEYDELADAATEVVVELGMASVSMLQRRLKLGYARAARIMDQLEEMGRVGPSEGSKPRQVLITREQWQELKFREGLIATVPGITPESDTPVPTPEEEGRPAEEEAL